MLRRTATVASALAVLTGGGALVTGGDFLSNTGFGLTLSAGDDVSLSDVNASDNGGVRRLGRHQLPGASASIPALFDSNTGFGLNASAVDQIRAQRAWMPMTTVVSVLP